MSISSVKCGEGPIAISSSYDKTLILWELKKGNPLMKLEGHKDAGWNWKKLSYNFFLVLDFIWIENLLFSGDRGGGVKIWDLNIGKAIKSVTSFKSQITAMDCIYSSNLGLVGSLVIILYFTLNLYLRMELYNFLILKLGSVFSQILFIQVEQ